MTENQSIDSFPNGVDYTQYTVEGGFLYDTVTNRPGGDKRRGVERRTLRAAESVHAHPEIAEARCVSLSSIHSKARTSRAC